MNKKQLLDDLVKKYENPEFILNDPIQFPHIFNNKQDIEISGLIASSLAYGKREHIIQIVQKVHDILGSSPYEFCLNFKYENDKDLFKNINYRYTTGHDLAMFINSISCALHEYKSLENIFMSGFKKSNTDIKKALEFFVKQLISYAPPEKEIKGLQFLLPDPARGSACKRLNLYLKWMIRKGSVDLNIWNNIGTEKLLIPLDTHVAKTSRKLNFTTRKSNDWKTAEEITQQLRLFDKKDPVKYDFALFGFGIFKDTATTN